VHLLIVREKNLSQDSHQKGKMKINHHTPHLISASDVFCPASDFIFPGPVIF